MRHLLHRMIAWYTWRVGCAFHLNQYGSDGRYVVLMNERQYHEYANWIRDTSDAMQTRAAIRAMTEAPPPPVKGAA